MRPMLSAQDLKKVADLARIDVPEGELAALAGELDAILGYVQDVSSIPAPDALAATETRNVMRADANPHEPGVHTPALIAQFPERSGEYLKVKKIL